jgi:hypothetical protein
MRDTLMRLLIALAVVTIAGCDPEQEGARPPTDNPPATKAEKVKGGKDAPAGDMIADLPEAVPPKAEPLLTDLAPAGAVGPTAKQAYVLIADIKTTVEQINTDLDTGGKEITRLSRTSDTLARQITELAGVWPLNESFRDVCGSAKRQALLLNDELSRVPRQWKYVRWTFTNVLKEVSRLRMAARELAEAEPKPVLLVGKDGKPVLDKQGRQVYVDAPAPAVDPLILKREAAVREATEQRARMRAIEEQKKNPRLKTELD